MNKPEYHTIRAHYGLDPFVQGDGYAYTLSQVRQFSEGVTTLTPLETLLLDRIDELTLNLEEN